MNETAWGFQEKALTVLSFLGARLLVNGPDATTRYADQVTRIESWR